MALAAIAFGSNTASAQNANRKGWVIELQGGRTFGTVCETSNFSYAMERDIPAYRLKSGIKGALGFGYRWTTSHYCAFEAKLVVSDNFAETKLLNVAVMPGFRYTTKEISGNLSMYVAANVGVGVYPAIEEIGYSAAGDAGVGFNIGSRLSLGLFVDYTAPFGDGELEKTDMPKVDGKGEWRYLEVKSNATVGIKLGFRI